MRVNEPVRTPGAALSVKRRNWLRAVPVVGSMDRDTVSWTGMYAMGEASVKTTWRGWGC